MPIAASAPGKLVLAGEYAVLDGAPAICMAVDRRARVTISQNTADHHAVVAPGFCSAVGNFKVQNGGLEWLTGHDDFKLVDAVWCTAKAAVSTSLSIQLDTAEFLDAEAEAKIGIGSSAALTVALAAALCTVAQTDADATSIAFEAHRRFQGGHGSGVDIACSTAGGLLEYSMVTGEMRQIAWPEDLAHAFVWSGVATSTSDKLAQLSMLEQRPSRAALLKSAKRIAKAWRDGSTHAILDQYRDYTQVLREFSIDHELGIFDAGHAELADAAAAAGLVYKPCGAGGGDVGIVLAHDGAILESFVRTAIPPSFRVLNMQIDPRGVQVAREEH